MIDLVQLSRPALKRKPLQYPTGYFSYAGRPALHVLINGPEVHVMTPEERLAIDVARMSDQGRAFVIDVQFRSAVDAWIEGDITMRELRAKYGDFLQGRRQRLRAVPAIVGDRVGHV